MQPLRRKHRSGAGSLFGVASHPLPYFSVLKVNLHTTENPRERRPNVDYVAALEAEARAVLGAPQVDAQLKKIRETEGQCHSVTQLGRVASKAFGIDTKMEKAEGEEH